MREPYWGVPLADFIHLKVRSAYSLTEGANKVDKIVSLAKEAGMPAVAVTDRNNLFGALEFSQYAAKAGIQPIVGVDLAIRREEEGGVASGEGAGHGVKVGGRAGLVNSSTRLVPRALARASRYAARPHSAVSAP